MLSSFVSIVFFPYFLCFFLLFLTGHETIVLSFFLSSCFSSTFPASFFPLPIFFGCVLRSVFFFSSSFFNFFSFSFFFLSFFFSCLLLGQHFLVVSIPFCVCRKFHSFFFFNEHGKHIIIIDRFYIALFFAVEQTHCARM